MRLIDADELMEHVWRDKLDSRALIAEMIDNAPTVKEIPMKIPINIFEQLISKQSISKQSKKDILLEELSKEDLQVLSLAYVYSKNLHMYGEDVTKAISTATQNAAILDKAYRKGYYDAMNSMSADKEAKHDKSIISL